ncbi:MAG: hypothetical protein WCF07_11025 [Nitrososphaeraceae archaeon]
MSIYPCEPRLWTLDKYSFVDLLNNKLQYNATKLDANIVNMQQKGSAQGVDVDTFPHGERYTPFLGPFRG